MKIKGKELLKFCRNYCFASQDKKGRQVLSRFNESQRKMYDQNIMFGLFSETAAGIVLRFETDASWFTLRYKIFRLRNMVLPWVKQNGVGEFFSQIKTLSKQALETKGLALFKNCVDVYVNNIKLKTFKEKKRRLHFKFFNPRHEKVLVEVYLPLFSKIALSSLHIVGNVFVPQTTRRKMICFGDSITQGFYANMPSGNYVSRLANMIGFEALNQGIGGFWFHPDILLDAQNLGKTELVTVAYGTNDWNFLEQETIKKNVEDFFVRLNELYSDVPVFVITPIWRADGQEAKKAGSFEDVEKIIAAEAHKYDNITVVDGQNLTPHNADYYADRFLHPNDEGFSIMANRLAEIIKKRI